MAEARMIAMTPERIAALLKAVRILDSSVSRSPDNKNGRRKRAMIDLLHAMLAEARGVAQAEASRTFQEWWVTVRPMWGHNGADSDDPDRVKAEIAWHAACGSSAPLTDEMIEAEAAKRYAEETAFRMPFRNGARWGARSVLRGGER